jgi:protoporphyrinogen/coproporphyrinogen III oxidase
VSGHVVVIGGGIAGLAAAFKLYRDDPSLRITLAEAQPRLGGVIESVREDGYVLEEGPDLFLGSKPGGWDLACALGIEARLIGTRKGAGGAFLLSRGQLSRLPDGLTGLVPTKMMPFVKTRLISPLGKLRVAADFFIPPRTDLGDETVESFVVRRLGREMYQRIVEPLLSGIFAGDGSKLSVLATFPHMRASEREHGGMARAMLAAKKRERAARAAGETGRASSAANRGKARRPDQNGFVSFPGGQRELVDALERALTGPEAVNRVDIRTGTPVSMLAELPDGEWRVTLGYSERIDADGVILAVPSYAAATLLRAVDPTCARLLREIQYVSTATVNIAFRREDVPHALDGTGWTTPRIERRQVMACTWTSSKFEHRAPDGVALFRAFLGDATNQDVTRRSDDELVKLVREELRAVLGISAEPIKVHLKRYDRAMPQYNLGHVERVSAIEQHVARHRGLSLAGNSYRGVGIPDVISSGERAAGAILGEIHSRELSER